MHSFCFMSPIIMSQKYSLSCIYFYKVKKYLFKNGKIACLKEFLLPNSFLFSLQSELSGLIALFPVSFCLYRNRVSTPWKIPIKLPAAASPSCNSICTLLCTSFYSMTVDGGHWKTTPVLPQAVFKLFLLTMKCSLTEKK